MPDLNGGFIQPYHYKLGPLCGHPAVKEPAMHSRETQPCKHLLILHCHLEVAFETYTTQLKHV